MPKEKSLVNHYAEYFKKSEDFQQQLTGYDRFLKGKNGKFLRSLFADMKGLAAHRMFSPDFTHLSAQEKDIQQRVAFHVFQVLDFVGGPRKWVEKRIGMLESIKKRLPSKSEKPKTKRGATK